MYFPRILISSYLRFSIRTGESQGKRETAKSNLNERIDSSADSEVNLRKSTTENTGLNERSQDDRCGNGINNRANS